MKIGILSDTHIPSVGKSIPTSLLKAFERVDLIIHAGDLVCLEVLDMLTSLAPVKAVCGNMDPPIAKQELPDKLYLSIEGIKIGVTHGWGAPNGLIKRIRPSFPDYDCIIFGHSHRPICQWIEGILFLNPGSPTDKRFSSTHSFALLNIKGKKLEGEIISLPQPFPPEEGDA